MSRLPPPDLPDDPVDLMPVFTSRRKAEQLPSRRPASGSNGLEPGLPANGACFWGAVGVALLLAAMILGLGWWVS